MHKSLVGILVATIPVFSALSTLYAQKVSAQAAINITGKVTGTDGLGIPGVLISLKGQKASTLTGADGTYTLTDKSTGIKAKGSFPASDLSFKNRWLDFNIAEDGTPVQIRIFNLMGRLEATLFDGALSKGSHRINPFAMARPSQLAFLSVKIGKEEHTLKMFDIGNQGAELAPSGSSSGSSAGPQSAAQFPAMKGAGKTAASTTSAAAAYDTLLVSKAGYTSDYKRINSFAAAYDFFLAKPEAFWGDPATAPAATKVMTYVFLNRTNGKYPDNQIFWTFTGGDPVTKKSLPVQNGNLKDNPTLDVPLHFAGRVTFHLGTATGEYSDFIEQTVDALGWHGNTTRVDAYGLPMAMRLLCSDGHDELLGEKYEVFYLGREKFLARYKASVPTEFQHNADNGKGFRIIASGKGDGGFGPNQDYANYFAAYLSQLGLTGSGATTQDAFACSGAIFGQNAQLCGAVNRHVAHLPKTEWNNPENFYQQAPANFYAKFIHDYSFREKAYGFAYDDAASMAAFSECSKPKTLIVAIGF